MKNIYNHLFSGILPLLTLVVLLIEPLSLKSQCTVSNTGSNGMPTGCNGATLSLGPGETRTITGVSIGERIEILYTAPVTASTFYVANAACVNGGSQSTTYQFTAGAGTFTLGTNRNGNPGALWVGWGNSNYSAVLTYRRITPTLAANTPTSATFCNGGSQIITPATASNGTAVWQGTTPNGIATTPTGAQTVSAAGTYYFRPHNYGCFGTQQATSITVVADPSAPTATKSPNVATVCAGQTLTLTGVTDNGGGAGTCAIEYRQNGTGSWTTTLPSFSATAGTNTIEVRKNCNGSGCDISSVNTYSWTVVADPSAPTATKSPTDATVCAGQTLTLTGVTDNGGGTGTCNIEYRQNGSGSWTTTLPSFSATVGTNSIEVRKNCNGSGCDISPVSTYSWSVVADPSAPTATKSPNVATVCAGQTLTLTGVTDNGGGTGTCAIEYRQNGTGSWTTTLPSFSATAGTNTIEVRKNCDGSGCDISSVSTYSWTVVADPSAPTATKSPNVATVCAGQTLTLTGVTDNGGGTGVCNIEYRQNGTGSWVTTLPSFSATVGTNTIEVRKNCDGSGCDISSVSTYSWSVVADPTIPTLNAGSTSPASGSTVCRGATISVALNDGTGGTGTINNYYRYSLDNGISWLPSTAGQSWSAGGGTSFNIVTGPATSTVIVQTQRQATGNDCGTIGFTQVATWTAVDVPGVTNPIGGSICEGSSHSMSVTASGGITPYTYIWQYFNGISWVTAVAGVPSGSTYTGLGTNALQVNNLSGGTGSQGYQYRVILQSNGGLNCSDATSLAATINVHKIPNINPSSGGSMCYGGPSRNLTTDLDATSGVTWSITPSCPGCITGGPSPAAYVFTAPDPSPFANTSYGFVARNANNSTCASGSLNINVYNNDPSNAGDDQAQCSSGSFTMAANTPNYGTGAWSCISGCAGVGIGITSSPTTSITGVAANSTTQLRWRITNGSCQSDDFVNLTHDIPATFTSPNTDMCEFGTRTLIASLGGGTFYGSCGPCVSGNVFTAPNVTGVSQTINLGYNVNTCPDAAQTITVFNTPQPTVDAGPDQNVCGTSADLAATQLTVGNGVWTLQAGSASFTPANSNYDATANGLANGNNTLRWTATNGACSGFDEVVIKSNQAPTAIPHAVGTFTATRECLDVATGYTHYFDNGSDATANTADDRRLISLKKNGNNIGTVGVGGFDARVTLDPNYGSNGYKIGLPGATYVQNNVNTWAVMARYWNVTPSTQPSSDVEVKFYFDETDYQDVLNMAASQGWEPIQVPYLDLQFYKMLTGSNPSPATGHNGVTPTDVQIYDVNAYHPNVKQWSYSTMGSDHVATFEVSSFSGGGGGFGGGGQGALPVELLYLTATAINNSYISVDWATVLEINNAGFEVQRSTDAQNWSTLTWVPGHNNSTVQHTYQYKDQNVQKGIVYYYRLKQIDNDGHFEYTKIVNAILNGKNTFTVMDFVPNPTLDQTSLLITANAGTEITVEFYNGIGEKMNSGKYLLTTGVNTIPFTVNHLAAGTYTALVTNGNEVYSKKLIVTR